MLFVEAWPKQDDFGRSVEHAEYSLNQDFSFKMRMLYSGHEIALYLVDMRSIKMWRVFSMLEASSHHFGIVKHIMFWVHLLY